MIELGEYKKDKNLQTLKAISINKQSNGVWYMCNSLRKAYNFDDIKNQYVRNLNYRPAIIPSSNDALILNEREACFVEFKDGRLDDKKKIAEIKRKIFESLLLLCDISKVSISDTRKFLDYILVYNLDKNDKLASPAAFEIGDHLSNLSHKGNMDHFKLREAFQGLYFRNVTTMSAEEFNNSDYCKCRYLS